MSAIQVDTTRLPLLLHDLRLPAITRLWPEFAERADKEGWPAARFLSALAELEIAERGRRRTERNLAEAHLLPSKTLDNFDFSVVPMLSKARVMALAAGDTWLDKATNLLLFGPPGTGKSHAASAIGRALVENGYRVLFTRTTEIVQKLQAARQALQLEAAIGKLDKLTLRNREIQLTVLQALQESGLQQSTVDVIQDHKAGLRVCITTDSAHSKSKAEELLAPYPLACSITLAESRLGQRLAESA